MDAPLILCVDDNELFLESLQDKLAWDGYASTTTTSVRTALRFIREQPFEVLLTDFAMPEMDGVALAEAAKSIRPRIKAILLTGARDLPASPVLDAAIHKGDSLPQLCSTIKVLLAKTTDR